MQTVQSDIIIQFSKGIKINQHFKEGISWDLCRYKRLSRTYLDGRHKLGESLVLLADLEGELPGVAHDQDGDLTVHGLDLLQGGQHEHSGLAHTRLGLAQHVHAQHSLQYKY